MSQQHTRCAIESITTNNRDKGIGVLREKKVGVLGFLM
jgi:hypothetical protein